jgi:superoxide dismutase, Fe-Mn family
MAQLYELPPLKYAFDALDPAIDAMTMEIHHDKHHAGYVNNLNKALEPYPEWQGKPIESLLQAIPELPTTIQSAVRNNGGGHANHTLFWDWLIPISQKAPEGFLLKEIAYTFGSFDAFQKLFSDTALSRFGSGWAWLVVNKDKKLAVYSTANQDSPYSDGNKPILGLDVWEHAYYLKYQNRRADYIKSYWSIVNWDTVNHLFEAAR